MDEKELQLGCGIAPTITASIGRRTSGFTDAFVITGIERKEDVRLRCLTPLECERLQGFPDNWTMIDEWGSKISDADRYKMLGNAVAVPVARWLGERIVRVLSK